MRFVQFARSSGEIIAILEMTQEAAQLQRTDQLDVIADDHALQHRHRIDPTTKAPYDYVPPRPDEDHDWDADKWQWVLKPDAAERNASRRSALAELEALDQKQARPALELALDPSNEDARNRLQAILNRKAELRLKLK